MATSAQAYTVKSGDSLWRIAHKHFGHGAMWPVIFVYNQRQELQQPGSRRLVDPDKIYTGQVIHLPTDIDPELLRRAPGQRAIPGPVTETGPALEPGQTAPGPMLPRSILPRLHQARVPNHQGDGTPSNGQASKTLLNDFNIRFDTSTTLLKRKVGQFEVEIQFKGWVSLRHDKLIQATTFSNKTVENQRKMELGHALGDLIATRKLKIEWTTGKIEYECLLTTHLSSGKPAPVSTGFVLEGKVPPLAWRTKIDLANSQGHWNDIIYRTENLSITITVRWKPDARNPKPPSGTTVVSLVPAVAPVIAQAAPAPTPTPVPTQAPPSTTPALPQPNPSQPTSPAVPAPASQAAPFAGNDPASTPDTGDHEGETWLGRAWHWVEHHPAEVAGAVVVAVVVVAAAPEIAAALATGALARGATATLTGVAVSRMTSAGPGV